MGYEFCVKCGEQWPLKGRDLCSDCQDAEYAEVGCPGCGSVAYWDPEVGGCNLCGYDAITQSSVMHSDDTEDVYDGFTSKSFDPTAKSAFEGYRFYRRETSLYDPGNLLSSMKPYDGFDTLVKKLEKWPWIKVHDTDHWFNKWYCKWFLNKPLKRDVTHYPKAIGPAIFIPRSDFGTRQGYKILMHEGVHAKDFWKFGVIPFFLMQMILPWGPSFKALLEYRGYVASMQAEYDLNGKVDDYLPKFYADAFASRVYTYCWPWPKLMTKWFEAARQKILKQAKKLS